MGHKHNRHRKAKKKGIEHGHEPREMSVKVDGDTRKHLELVLKCDSEGSREALLKIINEIKIPGLLLAVISSGVGEISKSDLFMAGTGSRLIVGFGIEVNKATETEIHHSGVEVRLYDVIYKVVDDLTKIGTSLLHNNVESERILGKAKVVALFKSSRKGIILGCEVLEGRLALGDKFRVIGAMGEIHTGRIRSLHIGQDAVDSAGVGRKVGLKIENFNRAAVGDYVESMKHVAAQSAAWVPVSGVIRLQEGMG